MPNTNIQLELEVNIKDVNLDIKGEIHSDDDLSIISLSGVIEGNEMTFKDNVKKLLADEGDIKDIITPFIPNALNFGVYKISKKDDKESLSAFQLGAKYEDFSLEGVLGKDTSNNKVSLFSVAINHPISLVNLPLVGEYLEEYTINSLDIVYDVYGNNKNSELIDLSKKSFVKDRWYSANNKEDLKKNKLSKGFNASMDISLGANPITIQYPLIDLGIFKLPELPTLTKKDKQKPPLVKVNNFKLSVGILDTKVSDLDKLFEEIVGVNLDSFRLSIGDIRKLYYEEKYTDLLTALRTFKEGVNVDNIKTKVQEFAHEISTSLGINVSISADFNIGPFGLQVIGLGISVPFTVFQQFSLEKLRKEIDFSLKGLALIYDTPAISIAGAFLRESYSQASIIASINVLVGQINQIIAKNTGTSDIINEYKKIKEKMPSQMEGIMELIDISKSSLGIKEYNTLQSLLCDLDNNVEKLKQLNTPEKYIEEYNGLLTFRLAKKIEVIAIGSYIKTPAYSSIFAFGYLGVPIPVDPAFFIHGFALGFGLNRNFVMPNISEIPEFPLVKIVHQGGLKQGDNVQKIFSDLNKYLPASEDTYIIVAGIKFDSYKMIFTTGIVAIAFGNQTSFNLLGFSIMQLPGVYNFEFAFSMRVDLDEGTFLAQGQLTDNTYILFPQLKLTGGFALGMWLKGENAGDFVFTLGGYHPRFKVPTYYPNNVNRLGYNFYFGPVQFYGEAYFALTPSCIMAGIAGGLRVALEGKAIYAEIGIQFRADFLIDWKPFYYQAIVRVQTYVKVVLGIGILSVSKTLQLSASLHIEGPEFGGVATFYIASYEFNKTFGAGITNRKRPILSKDEFIKAYLPEAEKIFTYNITSGILKKFKNEKGEEIIVVNPKTFALEINSEIPITEILMGESPSINVNLEDGIKPVCSQDINLSNLLNLELSVNDKKTDFKSFIPVIIKKSVPKAIWNNTNQVVDKLAEENLLRDVCKGIRLEFKHENSRLSQVTVSLYDTLVKDYDNQGANLEMQHELGKCEILNKYNMKSFNLFTDDEIDYTDLYNPIDVYKYKSQTLGSYKVV